MANEMWGIDPKTGTLKHYGRPGMAWGHNYFNPNYKPIGEEAQGVVSGASGAARRSAGNNRNYAVRDFADPARSSKPKKVVLDSYNRSNTAQTYSGAQRMLAKNPNSAVAVRDGADVRGNNGRNSPNPNQTNQTNQTNQKSGNWFDNLASNLNSFFKQSVATVGGWINKGKEAITNWAAGAGEFIGKRVSDVGNFVNSGKAAFDKWWNGYDTKVATAKRTGPDTMDVRPGYKNVHTNGARDNIAEALGAAGKWVGDRYNDARGAVKTGLDSAGQWVTDRAGEVANGFNNAWYGHPETVMKEDPENPGTRYTETRFVPGIGTVISDGFDAARGAVQNGYNTASQWVGDRVNDASQWIGDTARAAGNRADQAAQQIGQAVVGRDMVNNQRANGDVMDYNMGRMPVHVNGAVDNMRNAAAPIIEDLGNGLARIQTATGNWITDTRNNIEDYLRRN